MKSILILVLLFVGSLNTFSQTPLTDLELSAYLGKYKIETNDILAQGEVRMENSNLYFFTDGIQEVKLLQEVEFDKFKADKFDVKLQFIRNEFKEVIAVKIWFQGQEFLATKNAF